jgi:hypothetical protein
VEVIVEPGTIDDLVSDAARQGHRITPRLVRDWTEAGLLDYPQRRSAGQGYGSRQALYSAAQRMLLLALLHHRPENRIRNLARIPVGMWIYFGDDYVPLRQARRAFMTWLGDPRVSKSAAKGTAEAVLQQLSHPAATHPAKRHLLNLLTDVAYTARADYAPLEEAVRAVFEPNMRTIRRAVGHPSAPLTADSIVILLRARLTAVEQLHQNQVTDQDFIHARQQHLIAHAQYATAQPLLAVAAPADSPGFYEPVRAEIAFNNCCADLLTVLGLATP